MFMHRIRRATKKHRKVLFTVIILLAIGVVGAFSVWDSNAGQGSTSYSAAVSQYEEEIAKLEKKAGDAPTYDQALELAQYYQEMGMYAYYAYMMEGGDMDHYNLYMDSLADCADYYMMAGGLYAKSLESADYDAAIENYSNYLNAASLYSSRYYGGNAQEDYDNYVAAVREADKWLDAAFAASDADVATADYATAYEMYARSQERFQLKLSIMEADGSEDNTAYVEGMKEAYAWISRAMEVYEAEKGAENAELAVALGKYNQSGNKYALSHSIAETADDAEYRAYYEADIQESYELLETVIALKAYDMASADYALAEEACNYYDDLAGIASEAAEATGDASFNDKSVEAEKSAYEWRKAMIEKNGVEMQSATAQEANNMALYYNQLAGRAQDLFESTQDASYQTAYISNLKSAYDWTEQSIKAFDTDIKKAEYQDALNIADSYEVLSEQAETLYKETGDMTYGELIFSNEESSLEWMAAAIEKAEGAGAEELAALYVDLAGRYDNAEKYAEAAQAYANAMKQTPADSEIAMEYAEYLADQGDEEGAVKVLEDCLAEVEEGSDDQILLQDAIAEYQAE